jgi:Zn-finger nucleic acid-binding protein
MGDGALLARPRLLVEDEVGGHATMATKSKKKPAPAKKSAPAKKPAPAKKSAVKAQPAAKAAAAPPVDDTVKRALEAARADVTRLTGELQAARTDRDRDRIRGDGEQAAQKARGQIAELEKLRSETLKGSVDLATAARKADEAGRRADEAGRRADEATRFADEAGRRSEERERERARLARELDSARLELVGYKLRCPKCGKNFVEEDYEGITIDRCTGCDAVYFDAGEVDQLIVRVHEKMTAPSADAQQTSGWFKKLFKRKAKGGEPTGGEPAPPAA